MKYPNNNVSGGCCWMKRLVLPYKGHYYMTSFWSAFWNPQVNAKLCPSHLFLCRRMNGPYRQYSTLGPLNSSGATAAVTATGSYHGRMVTQQRLHWWWNGWMAYSGLLLFLVSSLECNNNNNNIHPRPFKLLFQSTTTTTTECQEDKNAFDDNDNDNDKDKDKDKDNDNDNDNNKVVEGGVNETFLEIPPPPPFPDSVLSYDLYNGVTLYLGKYLKRQTSQQQQPQPSNEYPPPSELSFRQHLDHALQLWKDQGRKGIWIQVPPVAAHWIPDCIQAGFDFHNVLLREDNGNNSIIINDNDNNNDKTKDTTNGDNNNNCKPSPSTLVLSKWLPDTPSKLPLGATHQVGVGVVVLNPSDPSQMLCVQEQSGPGKYKLKTNVMLIKDGERGYFLVILVCGMEDRNDNNHRHNKTPDNCCFSLSLSLSLPSF
jgi:hypothetical protein